jgi:hypothetical protein
MNQLCLSRQYFPLRDFSGFRVHPEAEARIIQPAYRPSSEKFQLIFRPAGTTRGAPATACLGSARKPRDGRASGIQPACVAALGGETFSTSQ